MYVVYLSGLCVHISQNARSGWLHTLQEWKLHLLTFLPVSVAVDSVHLFVFQKDEPELLFPWILYHSRIVGLKNLHIIDHNSTNMEVVRILQACEKHDVDVDYFTESFASKQHVISAKMKAYHNESSLLIPLDTDEFIVSLVNSSNVNQFSAKSQVIRRNLMRLPYGSHKLKFNGSFQAVSTMTGSVSLRPFAAVHFQRRELSCMSKTFYSANTFVRTDQGNHHGTIKTPCTAQSSAWNAQCNDCFHVANLALAHFDVSSTSFGSSLSKHLRGAKAYGHDKVVDEGKPCKGNGVHYCQYLKQLKRVGSQRLESEFYASRLLSPGQYNSEVVEALVEPYQ